MPMTTLVKVTPNLYVVHAQVAAVSFTRDPRPRINVQLASGQWVADDGTALEFNEFVGATPEPGKPAAGTKAQASRNPRRK